MGGCTGGGVIHIPHLVHCPDYPFWTFEQLPNLASSEWIKAFLLSFRDCS